MHTRTGGAVKTKIIWLANCSMHFYISSRVDFILVVKCGRRESFWPAFMRELEGCQKRKRRGRYASNSRRGRVFLLTFPEKQWIVTLISIHQSEKYNRNSNNVKVLILKLYGLLIKSVFVFVFLPTPPLFLSRQTENALVLHLTYLLSCLLSAVLCPVCFTCVFTSLHPLV